MADSPLAISHDSDNRQLSTALVHVPAAPGEASLGTGPYLISFASRLDRQELQQLLPPGLVLDQQRALPEGHGGFYDCWDHRLQGASPIRRSLQVIEIAPDDRWTDELRESLRTLAGSPLPGVCQPLEMGTISGRAIYLVFPWFPAVLADHIPASGLSDQTLAWSILAQLIQGLASLHRRGLTHGDLRTATIYLDTPTLTDQTRAWIGHVELGHLPYWTDGARMSPQTPETFPPEWHRQLQAPTPAADVYALGLIAVELLAGAHARRKLITAKGEASNDRVAMLKNRTCWWRRRWLICPLLTDSLNRLQDGPAVLRRWLQIRHFERMASSGAGYVTLILGAVIVCCLGLGWMSRQLHDSQVRIGELEQQSAIAQERVALLRTQQDARQAQRAEAVTQAAVAQRQTSLPAAEIEARRLWTNTLAGHPSEDYEGITKGLSANWAPDVKELVLKWQKLTQDGEIAVKIAGPVEPGSAKAQSGHRQVACTEFRQSPWEESRQSTLTRALWHDITATATTSDAAFEAVTATLSKLPESNWVKKALKEQWKPLRERRASWARWQAQPRKLIEPWLPCVKAPWEESARAAAADRLAALLTAEKAWREVAGRGELTWNEFKIQLKEAVGDNPRAAEVASVWIDQFNQWNARSKATLELLSGHSPPGYGTYRTFDVHVADSYTAVDDELSGDTWDSATDHVYPTPRQITFPWQPGQKIEVIVYGQRSIYAGGSRWALIRKSYAGPVALWALAQDRLLISGEGERQHRLRFTVKDCPGPPPLPEEVTHLKSLLGQ